MEDIKAKFHRLKPEFDKNKLEREQALKKLEAESPLGSNFGMLLFILGGFIVLAIALGIITFVVVSVARFAWQ